MVLSVSPEISTFDKTYINSVAGGAVLQLFECYDNITSCAVHCNNSVACFGSTFTINSPVATINCGSNFACGYSTINASYEDDHLESLHVICDQESSCIQSQINVESINEFILDCIEFHACLQVTVNLKNITNSSIICYELSFV